MEERPNSVYSALLYLMLDPNISPVMVSSDFIVHKWYGMVDSHTYMYKQLWVMMLFILSSLSLS